MTKTKQTAIIIITTTRLIDGREAVTFLKSIAAKIEDPSRLLLSI